MQDALRKGHQHPAAEPDIVKVRNSRQFSKKTPQNMGGKEERVAAGNQDVIHLRMGRNVVIGLLEPADDLVVGDTSLSVTTVLDTPPERGIDAT